MHYGKREGLKTKLKKEIQTRTPNPQKAILYVLGPNTHQAEEWYWTELRTGRGWGDRETESESERARPKDREDQGWQKKKDTHKTGTTKRDREDEQVERRHKKRDGPEHSGTLLFCGSFMTSFMMSPPHSSVSMSLIPQILLKNVLTFFS